MAGSKDGAEIVVLSLLFAVSCKYRKVWTVPEAHGDVAKGDQPEDHQPSSTVEPLWSFQYNNTFCCHMCTEQILPSLLCLSRHLRDSEYLPTVTSLLLQSVSKILPTL